MVELMLDEMREWLKGIGCLYLAGMSPAIILDLVERNHVDGLRGFILANA